MTSSGTGNRRPGRAGRAAAADEEATRAWAGTLGPLGEWAWRAAIEPVLDAVRGRGGKRGPSHCAGAGR